MIDLNCDAGEGFGRWSVGDDAELFRYVTSANIACGLHAGDPTIIARTVELAHRHDIAVGAHPGYPDLQGFGRRALALDPTEVEALVLYQIGAVAAFTRTAGVPLVHVKPHGALYNQAAGDPAIAGAITRAVRAFDPQLILVGLTGSALVEAGAAAGLAVAREAFADRAYEPDGSLRSRALPGAVLHDPSAIVEQVVAIAVQHTVASETGLIAMEADTICLHGDTPGAATLAAAVREGLDRAGVVVRPLPVVLAARGNASEPARAGGRG